jgi:hypothetical protein
MSKQIELAVEKLNKGHWLKITIPYASHDLMTASLLGMNGELIRSVKVVTGSNLIDIAALIGPSLRVRIDTPYEIISKELKID